MCIIAPAMVSESGCQSISIPAPEEDTSTSTVTELPQDIAKEKSDSPAQPNINFPTRIYGSRSRSFQLNWYTIFPWIEYSMARDAVFCFPCRFFGVSHDKTFTCSGFRDWKHARGKEGPLSFHDSMCNKHKEAVLDYKQYKSSIADETSIAVQLDRERLKNIQDNRKYVKTLLECLLYCAQQGIPLRGHRETNLEDLSVNIGNFRALMILQSRHDEVIKHHMTMGPRNAS